MFCEPCGQLVFDCMMGECSGCGKTTSSGAFSLCRSCSISKTECESCRHLLSPEWIEQNKDSIPKVFNFLVHITTITEMMYTVEACSEEEAKEMAENGDIVKEEELAEPEIVDRSVIQPM